MVERYSRPEMEEKWTQHARYAAWLEVEKAAVKAYTMNALFLLGKNYDWVHQELKLIIQQNIMNESAAYKFGWLDENDDDNGEDVCCLGDSRTGNHEVHQPEVFFVSMNYIIKKSFQ